MSNLETYARYLLEFSEDNGHRMSEWAKPVQHTYAESRCSVCGGFLRVYLSPSYQPYHQEETISTGCEQLLANKVVAVMA